MVFAAGDKPETPGKGSREKRKMKFKAILLLFIITALQFDLSAQQFKNGNFENSNTKPALYDFNPIVQNYPNLDYISDWEYIFGAVDLHNWQHGFNQGDPMGVGGEGEQHVDLNGEKEFGYGGIIQQKIDVVANSQYNISFITRVHRALLSTEKCTARLVIEDAITGVIIKSFDWSLDGTQKIWSKRNVSFTSTAEKVIIRYIGITSDNEYGGILIDDVEISGQPCNELIYKNKVNCSNSIFTLSNFGTNITKAKWSVNGQEEFEGLTFNRSFTPGIYTICAKYEGTSKKNENEKCINTYCITVVITYKNTICNKEITIDCNQSVNLDNLNWEFPNAECEECGNLYDPNAYWVDEITEVALLNTTVSPSNSTIYSITKVDPTDPCKKCTIKVKVNVTKATKVLDIYKSFNEGGLCCENFSYFGLANLFSTYSNCGPLPIGADLVVTRLNAPGMPPVVMTSNNINIFEFCQDIEYEINVSGAVNYCCKIKIRVHCSEGEDRIVVSDEEDPNPNPGNGMQAAPISNSTAKGPSPITLTLIPNPSEGLFQIQDLQNAGLVYDEVQVLDIAGKVVFSKLGINSEAQIDISTQAPGMYFVKVRIGDRLETLKVMKH